MSDSQLYAELVERLKVYNYEIEAIEHGYLVRNRSDPEDTSHARNLDDLTDLADLIQWRALYDVRRQQAR